MHIVQKRHDRDDRGASAVEFALIVPILLVVVFGIVNFGFVFAQQISLNNGARQAARYAVVDNRTCAQIEIEGQTSAATIGMDTSDVPVPSITSCPVGSTLVKPCTGKPSGTNVTVTMTRSATWAVPFPPLFTAGNAPALTGTGVMRCEFK